MVWVCPYHTLLRSRVILDEEISPEKHAHKTEASSSKPATAAAMTAAAASKGSGSLSMPVPKSDLSAGTYPLNPGSCCLHPVDVLVVLLDKLLPCLKDELSSMRMLRLGFSGCVVPVQPSTQSHEHHATWLYNPFCTDARNPSCSGLRKACKSYRFTVVSQVHGKYVELARYPGVGDQPWHQLLQSVMQHVLVTWMQVLQAA